MIYGIRSRATGSPAGSTGSGFRRITVVLDDSDLSRVLAIAAHPDDLDFSAAGTIAAWTSAGIEVVYCVVTDGDAGGFDETFPRDEMGPLRRAEQTAAAKCVGVDDIRRLRQGRPPASSHPPRWALK